MQLPEEAKKFDKINKEFDTAWKFNLTPSTRVASVRRGRGWSLVQI